MDIYAAVTDRIIEQLEQGVIPWQKPWVASSKAISYGTGNPYSLLNQLMLGRPGEYLTFNQCQKAGGRVRKGEKAGSAAGVAEGMSGITVTGTISTGNVTLDSGVLVGQLAPRLDLKLGSKFGRTKG